MNEKLLLIDANSLIHRSFHALPPFTNAEGEPVGGIYGVASILMKLWKEEKPKYAAALFDRAEPTFRKEKYAEYKAQRAESPDELVPQLKEAHNLFNAFGVRTFDAPGFEADDLIATFAERFGGEKGLQVVILTGDRDTLQMVKGDKIVVRSFRKGVSDTMTYDEAAVKEHYGLSPKQLTDYKALVGDASDNIRGVPGIGPKTACALLWEFGSAEDALRSKKESVALNRLREMEALFRLSRELVELKKDVPVSVSLEDLHTGESKEAVSAYLSRQGFGTLLKRLENGDAPKKTAKPAKKESQGKIF